MLTNVDQLPFHSVSWVVFGAYHPLDLGPLAASLCQCPLFISLNPVGPVCFRRASASWPGGGLTWHIICSLHPSAAVCPFLRWIPKSSLPCPSSLSALHQQTRCPQASHPAMPHVLCWPNYSAQTPVLSPAVSKLASAEGPSTALKSPEQACSL